MNLIKRCLFSALLAPLLGGPLAHAVEFQVLDKFSVDGYTEFRGSAAVAGGNFAVGGSTFVVKGGNVGVGTTSPTGKLNIVSASITDNNAFRVDTAGGLNAVFVSTNGNTGIGTANPQAKFSVGFNDGDQVNIYSPGQNSLAIQTTLDNQSLSGYAYGGGENRLLLQPLLGYVGIGTTAPGYGFEVINAAGAHLSTTATAGYGFYLNTAGNVGIGAAGSGKKLLVQTNTAWDGILINDGVNDKGFIVNNNSGGTQIGLNNGATRKVTIDTDGNSYFSGGSVGIGATAPQGRLNISNNGAEGLEVYPGNASGVDALQFYNRSSSSYDAVRLIANSYRFEINGTEKVRLDSSGNVGIGTTAPGSKLTIGANPVGLAGAISVVGTAAGISGAFSDNANSELYIRHLASPGAVFFDSDSGNYMRWGNNNTVKMTLDNNGNLGIGTESPGVKLEVNGRIKDQTGFVMPVGSIIPYGGATAPAGWLLCDGTSFLKTDYPDLFGVIGAAYGSADGNHFNVPDLRGRVAVGKNAATFAALGAAGGEETHTLTTGELATHTHIQDAHSHTFTVYQTLAEGNGYPRASVHPVTPSDQGTSAATATNQNTGGGLSHNNLQPYQIVNYIIKI